MPNISDCSLHETFPNSCAADRSDLSLSLAMPLLTSFCWTFCRMRLSIALPSCPPRQRWRLDCGPIYSKLEPFFVSFRFPPFSFAFFFCFSLFGVRESTHAHSDALTHLRTYTHVGSQNTKKYNKIMILKRYDLRVLCVFFLYCLCCIYPVLTTLCASRSWL